MRIQTAQELINTHDIDIFKYKNDEHVALFINCVFIGVFEDISWIAEELQEQAVYHNPVE